MSATDDLAGDTEDLKVEDDADDDEVESGTVFTPGLWKLRPSGFRCVPPTVYVDYPPDINIQRTDIGVVEPLKGRRLLYKCHWERICIRNAFHRAGFVKSETSTWTALWSKHQTDSEIKNLNCLQKINHFPGSWCVGRKDRLLNTINAMKRLHGHAFDFHPDGYTIPAERDALLRLLQSETVASRGVNGTKKSVGEALWILKPVASSQGKGIRVCTSSQVQDYITAKATKNKSALMQRYVHDPYLINGHKFDLRIYVLVTGVDPLRVYVHHEGLTRISTAPYSLKNTKNRFAHLTNYSVNKKSPSFVAAAMGGGGGSSSKGGFTAADGSAAAGVEDNSDIEGFKWSLAAFRRWLAKQEGAVVMERAMAKVHDLVVKTMVAAEAEITPRMHNAASYRTNCFELFGLDVMLDRALEPHLLEVNISPSLMGSSPLDKRIKGMLVADILHVVGMYPHDEGWLRKISRLDENNNRSSFAGAAGSGTAARSRSKSGGRSPRRARSVPRGSEKASKSGSGGAAGSNGNGNGNAPISSHTYRSSSVAPTPAGGGSASSSSSKDNGRDGSAGGTSSSAMHFHINPFAFNSLAVLMHNQDLWRRTPCPENVDFKCFKTETVGAQAEHSSSRGRNMSRSNKGAGGSGGSTDSIWMILLMIEDEFARAAHSEFKLLHPTPATVAGYLGMYRSARFSDHLLGKWVLYNGMHGPLREYVPQKFLHRPSEHSAGRKGNAGLAQTQTVPTSPGTAVASSATKLKLMNDVLSSRANAAASATDPVGAGSTLYDPVGSVVVTPLWPQKSSENTKGKIAVSTPAADVDAAQAISEDVALPSCTSNSVPLSPIIADRRTLILPHGSRSRNGSFLEEEVEAVVVVEESGLAQHGMQQDCDDELSDMQQRIRAIDALNAQFNEDQHYVRSLGHGKSPQKLNMNALTPRFSTGPIIDLPVQAASSGGAPSGRPGSAVANSARGSRQNLHSGSSTPTNASLGPQTASGNVHRGGIGQAIKSTEQNGDHLHVVGSRAPSAANGGDSKGGHLGERNGSTVNGLRRPSSAGRSRPTSGSSEGSALSARRRRSGFGLAGNGSEVSVPLAGQQQLASSAASTTLRLSYGKR